MAKISKEEQARREGMSYALRIAKDKGIGALEEEMRMRSAINLPVGVPKTALDEFVIKVKTNILDCVLILMCVTLHQEFGFGQTRCQRAITHLNQLAEDLCDDCATWQEHIEMLEKECNIELAIRSNDEDVRF